MSYTGGSQEPLLSHEQEGKDEGQSDNVSRKSRAGQVARAALNLINTGTGTSTVSIPMVVRTLGLGLALFSAALQSVLGIAANHVISRESDKDNAGSYHDLMQSRFGKWGGRAVAVAQAINSLGKLVVWLIILADVIVGTPGQHDGLLPELLHLGDDAEGKWYMRRAPWIVGVVLLSLPAISVRSLNKLSGISFLGDLACLFIAAAGISLWVVAGKAGEAHPLHWLPSREETGAKTTGRLVLEVGSALPVMLGAAFTQNNINTVMDQVRPYRQAPLDIASATARVTTIALFLTLGISNYAVFGTELHPDVLNNYSRSGLGKLVSPLAAAWLAATAKGAFFLNGIVSLPMYLRPYQRSMWDALPNQDPEERMADTKSFVLTNYVSIAACAVVAMLVPDVWKPLKLLGATAVSSMAFIYPGAILIAASKRGSGGAVPPREVVLGWVMVVVGVIQLFFGVVAQFI